MDADASKTARNIKNFIDITEEAHGFLRSNCRKTKVYIFSRKRKGLGNKACPKWNPQSEFTSDEEKAEVSRLLADGTSVLYFCLLVKGLNAMSL